jgi:hypothetical protein
MKHCFVLLLLAANICYGQGWEAEIMAGGARYKGDLTKSHFAYQTTRPAVAFNLKYNFDNVILLRSGIAFAQIMGDDKYNKPADLKARNLNFKTNIVELSLCAEYNLLEPEIFNAYPYIFGGAGVFLFNPYTYDKDNKKTYLRPLSTEGQGLAAYPERKVYSRTQFCLPFGAGWKWRFSNRYDLAYEIGYRILFTDYLDDVSTTYIDPQVLLAAKGAKAVELASRSKVPTVPGDIRGNSRINDWYLFSGVKLIMRLGKEL